MIGARRLLFRYFGTLSLTISRFSLWGRDEEGEEEAHKQDTCRERKKNPLKRCLASNRKSDQRVHLGSMGKAARAGEFVARNNLKGGVGGSQTDSLKSAENKRTVLPVLPIDDTVVRAQKFWLVCVYSQSFSLPPSTLIPWASWADENIMHRIPVRIDHMVNQQPRTPGLRGLTRRAA